MKRTRNIFSSAVIKLTLVYTSIILFICLGFSSAFYVGTYSELSRPIARRPGSTSTEDPNITVPSLFGINSTFEEIVRQRDEETRNSILGLLAIIDGTVLLLGACASYFLARWTLQPIQKMTEQQSNFISNASHELRTPLTVMTMENEVALRNPNLTKAELVEIVKSNLEETKKLHNLTTRLLKLNQKDSFDLISADIEDVVKTTVSDLSSLAKQKNITLKNKVKSHKILTNPDALTEILNILVENAIKYSSAKTSITITFSNNSLSVRDEGVGITDDDLPFLFDRFFRAEKSRTSKGYGLGLSLAKQLADQLNLEISVKNNSKKGCTFSINHFQ